MTNEQIIWNYLKSKGINEYGIAGLMGNLQAESGFKPNNAQNSFNKKYGITDEQYTNGVNIGTYTNFVGDSVGYGIAQWTSAGRKQGLYNLARQKGVSIGNLDMQLEFLYYELTNSYKAVLKGLNDATSVREASDIVLTKFERPKDQSTAVKKARASYGQAIYDRNASEKSGNGNMNCNRVLDIAAQEVGYLEKSASAYKSNPAILDSKTDGAGKDNYTKYGRDMHAIYPSVMDFPAAWCDCFVDWCFYKAYGVATAKSLLGGDFNDYTVASAGMYQKKGALDTTPTKGSQVFFTKNGQTSGCYHTGLVYDVDGTYFYTIEGNTSGASSVVSNGGGVCKKKYKIADYKGRTLFGHPKYDSVSNKETTTQKVEPATMFDKTLAGKYIVDTDGGNLNVRLGAGTNKPKVTVVKDGTILYNYGYYNMVGDVKWLYIQVGNVTGYCSTKYLRKS